MENNCVNILFLSELFFHVMAFLELEIAFNTGTLTLSQSSLLSFAFFRAVRPSEMPPDFPFIGTETDDGRTERERKRKGCESGKREEGGRLVSWELRVESGLQSFTLQRIHNCFQF